MSLENAEVMRACLDAFGRNDVSTFLRFMDPDVRFDPRLAAVEGTYTGHEGVKAFFADAWQHLKVVYVDCRDIRDLGDRVLAIGSFRMGGSGSGIEADAPFAILATFRQGRMLRVKDYGDKEEALLAAGLSE